MLAAVILLAQAGVSLAQLPPDVLGPMITPPFHGSGSGWDQGENRVGQEFDLPVGTFLSEVCAFMKGGSGNVTLRAARNAAGQPPTSHFLERVVDAGGTDGWSCISVREAWPGGSLLLYYESGEGKIGYRAVPAGTGNAYASYQGRAWQHQRDFDRGFGISLNPAASDDPETRPPRDGAGSGWDQGKNRVGQRFVTSGGTLEHVCLYMQGGSGPATYRVTDGGEKGSPEHFLLEGRVIAGLTDGWVCDAVSFPWTAPILQIYYESGSGKIGYRHVPFPTGNAWASYNGAPWQHQPDFDRGFGFTLR